MAQYVYRFGGGKAEGKSSMRDLLGGKGANLHEMTSLGLPVPPGFTLSTDVCSYFYEHGKAYPPGLKEEVNEAVLAMEKHLGCGFSDRKNPLLVSVRSGARTSMPGMMDTILNLGLNDETVEGLAEASKDRRFAFDAYRRFIQMYAEVVLNVPMHHFERRLDEAREKTHSESDSQIPATELEKLVTDYKAIVREQTGAAFPMDVREQLWGAMGAVFSSWMSQRAVSYRRIHKIPEAWGTAVTVQAMVFGNMGDGSATGVAFTRDPSTGEKRFFGEYLPNAQGEDVVAGIRTPLPVNEQSRAEGAAPSETMEKAFAEPYKELVRLYQLLEKHYCDMQDIEFTVQRGKLYLLQTRNGKRTAQAAVRIAVEMVREKLIDSNEALLRVTPLQIEQLLHPRLDPKHKKNIIAKGLPASPGAACGEVVFSSEEAEKMKKQNKPVLLVRHETSPEDIGGMDAAEGILTALGGMTSHAAVVARGMGKPCVAGCGSISIDYNRQQFTVGTHLVKRGEFLTIDGATGEVILGRVPTTNSQVDEYFVEFMKWVDGKRRLKVRANAETPNDVKVARSFGAEGVGLCRTEHMFFEESRIQAVREMIISESDSQREAALEKIYPMQKDDFVAIFREMRGFPVTVRLLDPPLHEFLPKSDTEIEALANRLGKPVQKVKAKITQLHEMNPMLGHRGCRLGVSFPAIYRMQVRAIMEAACDVLASDDVAPIPEIMIPFIGALEELRILKKDVVEVAEGILKARKVRLPYQIGTMIEIPRAALVADKLATEAEFFSFGTNDLTQMTLGMSRDDSGSFLGTYVEKGLYRVDPFVSVDQEGVGELMRIACERGRKTNSQLKVGICGEQGGDTATIAFCDALGLNYVSCSPFRVPVARLAAAQAALLGTKGARVDA